MKKIPCGFADNKIIFVIVDDEDFDELCMYAWHAVYQVSGSLKGVAGHMNGKHVLIHRVIMKALDSPYVVNHINNNPLDNQKANLELVTQKENLVHYRTIVAHGRIMIVPKDEQ